MSEWFVNLGTVTLTVIMVLFLLSVGVCLVSVVYVVVKTLKDEMKIQRRDGTLGRGGSSVK